MTGRRPYVIDVSRLLWRLNRDRQPTGIDRVCQAYVEGFANRSLALIQWKSVRFVLGPAHSDELFALLRTGDLAHSRVRLFALLARGLLVRTVRRPDYRESILLNVGHTGLNAPGLVEWTARSTMLPVYLIHDLIPITHPQFCRAGEDHRHTVRMRQALQSAAALIVNSQATADETGHFAAAQGLAMPPALVAHLGVEPLAGKPGPPPHPRPYFLCIGTIEARKNHALLLRVWERLRGRLGDKTPDLFLLGQRGWMADEVFAALDAPQPRVGRITELPTCDDDELATWISHARAVLMPSHIEGFGLPVLEAIALGAPVIANNLPVYREIAGDIPLLIDLADEDAWTAAIADYTGPGAERDRRIAAGANWSPPRWRDHTAQVERWLQATL